MKRRGRIFLLVSLVLLCLLFLSSCEVNIFGSSPKFVTYTEVVAENGRYLIWDGLLVDKQKGLMYPLEYEESTNPSYFELTDQGILRYTYRSVPKYDTDTGAIAYRTYYRTVITYDYYGQELSRTESEVALTEEEMLAEAVLRLPHSTSSVFTFSKIQGSGRAGWEPEIEPPAYTELQQKAVNYAFDLEKKLIGEFHYVCGVGRVIDGRLWFSVERYNKKDFMGQSAVTQGLYHSMVVCYDPTTDTFERMIEFDNGENVLAFDDGYVLVAKNGKIRSYSYETGKGEKVFDLGEYDPDYFFETADGILHLSRHESIHGESEDGTVRFSYPCKYHVFMTMDGTILWEDYDLTEEQKKTVEAAKNVEYGY